MNDYEIVKFVDNDFELDVRADKNNDTVWLRSEEMAVLFDVNRPAIVKHISNILKEGELDESTCSILEQVQVEGNRRINRKFKIYNLDMIISVGYRVKSKRGIIFRRWANQILKSYLINGYTINEKRCLECKDNYISLKNEVNELKNNDEEIKEIVLGKNYKKIKEGDVVDSIISLEKIFSIAKNRIIIIDNYIDDFILKLLEKYDVNIIIITGNNKMLTYELKTNIKIIIDGSYHTRYILIDDKYVYILTHSLNIVGRKDFEIIKVDLIKPKDILKTINMI